MNGEEIKDQQLPVEWIGHFRNELIHFISTVVKGA